MGLTMREFDTTVDGLGHKIHKFVAKHRKSHPGERLKLTYEHHRDEDGKLDYSWTINIRKARFSK